MLTCPAHFPANMNHPLVLQNVSATPFPQANRSLLRKRPLIPSSSTLAPLKHASCRILASQMVHLPQPAFFERQHDRMMSRSQADVYPTEDMNAEIEEEELDALFNEFGEVVLAGSNQRPLTTEVDDDSESLSFAVALAEAANAVKASEIKVLYVKPLIYWARFFVIATAFSRPQVDAVGKRMRDIAEEKFNKTSKGDTKPNSWTLLDFGDVVVHIFYPKERAYYNIEQFYGNATTIDLPFKSSITQ